MTGPSAKRVLIVEDEVLIAMLLEDLLTELGHFVVDHASRIEKAMALAHESDIDFAVLDINLAGVRSFPVADVLRDRGIPFAFATGYGVDGLNGGYQNVPVLQKPYSYEDLARIIKQVFIDRPR